MQFIQKHTSSTQSTEPSLVVYFDGGCPICAAEIQHYQRLEGSQRCVWIDASCCAESELGTGLTRSDALGRFHVRRPSGGLVGGMRGFAALWQTLPRMTWLGRLASIGPMPWLLDRAYGVFLALRPLWRKHVPAHGSSG